MQERERSPALSTMPEDSQGPPSPLDEGENPRYVVTSLAGREINPRELYEDLYCARGDMENRIEERQLHLFADRTSSSSFRANQIRLYFSSHERSATRSDSNANPRQPIFELKPATPAADMTGRVRMSAHALMRTFEES